MGPTLSPPHHCTILGHRKRQWWQAVTRNKIHSRYGIHDFPKFPQFLPSGQVRPGANVDFDVGLVPDGTETDHRWKCCCIFSRPSVITHYSLLTLLMVLTTIMTPRHVSWQVSGYFVSFSDILWQPHSVISHPGIIAGLRALSRQKMCMEGLRQMQGWGAISANHRPALSRSDQSEAELITRRGLCLVKYRRNERETGDERRRHWRGVSELRARHRLTPSREQLFTRNNIWFKRW